MLINPAIQSYAVIDPSALQLEPKGGSTVRSDISPVTEVVNSEKPKDNPYHSGDADRLSVADNARPSNPLGEQSVAGKSSNSANDNALANDNASSKAEEALVNLQQKEDELLIRQLRARDQEVRVHEAAHASAGGKYAGSPSLQFTRGPDGVNYAVSGEVSISVGKVSGDPQATIEKARVIRSAALAPASPSAQDRRVAAQASQLESEARVELQALALEERQIAEDRTSQVVEEGQEEEAVLTLEEAEADSGVENGGASAASDVRGVTSSDEDGESSEEDSSTDVSDAFGGKRTTAKDRLEDILLASKPLSVELNELGLIDAENPFGESGLISLIA